MTARTSDILGKAFIIAAAFVLAAGIVLLVCIGCAWERGVSF